MCACPYRASYQQLVKDVIINPHATDSGEDGDGSNADAMDHVRTARVLINYL